MTVPADDDEEGGGSVVRPFVLTRGRTRVSGDVRIESLVTRSELSPEKVTALDPGLRQIWTHLTERQSVAEVSAKLGLPLGVVLVLVGDMSEQDLVAVHKTAASNDTQLVRRLIDGVRAI